jgi:hypothetical protein
MRPACGGRWSWPGCPVGSNGIVGWRCLVVQTNGHATVSQNWDPGPVGHGRPVPRREGEIVIPGTYSYDGG